MTHKKSNNRFYPIEGFSGYYINRTSTQVLCTNEALPVILDQIPNSLGKDNYFIVVLSDNKNHFVHRLMAKTFLPGPEKEHVNHIDGNKQNNQLTNLEWATPQENAQHAYSTGLSSSEHCTKEVHQYQLGGKYLASFNSDVEAELATKCAKQNISKCTLGLRPQAGGYQWRRVKLDHIKSCNIKIIECIKVVAPNGVVTMVHPTRQDFYTEILKLTGKSKHMLTRRFKTNDVIFVDDYKFEKIYYL